MSTDETRPEGATNEQGGSADARPVGPDQKYAGPAFDQAADPATDPAVDPAPVAPGQKPYPESGFFASIRRGLFPRSDQRWVGGVAGGVAERIGWDPLLVRGLLIVSFFLGGLGLILYGIAWALLPERDGRIHLQEATRGDFDVAMLGSVAVFLTGFAWGGPGGWWDDGGWEWLTVFFWLAVLGVMFYLIVQGVQRRRDTAAAGVNAVPGAPAPGAPTGPAAPRPGDHGTTANFTPAPPVDYRRADGLVYATGAGPAPYRQPQAPYRSGPVQTAPPQLPYTPPAPRAHRGPGGTTVGITMGVILLTGALLLGLHRLNASGLPDDTAALAAVWLGVGTVTLGIAILFSAMRGRTSGVLGFFAIVAMLFGFMYVMVAGAVGPYWADDAISSGRAIEGSVSGPDSPDAATLTEGTVMVQTIREAESGFYVQWGDPTIDLSALDLSEVEPGDPVVVPIQLGAGQTVVLVPQDVAVEADAYVAAGAVQWNVDDQDRAASGVDTNNYFASDEVGEDGAVLSLQIEAGAGEVIVSEIQ
jgi:phage shock protein PspC (stress-responsive transcriptional regulator)